VARHRPQAARRGARARGERPPSQCRLAVALARRRRRPRLRPRARPRLGVAHNLAWAWDERDGWLEEHVEEARRILSAR
jgi:hypothetical protein